MQSVVLTMLLMTERSKGLQVWGSSSRHMQLHALINSICLYLFAFHPPIQRLVQDINDVRRMRALTSFELHMASQVGFIVCDYGVMRYGLALVSMMIA
jgi:hypothetical protein